MAIEQTIEERFDQPSTTDQASRISSADSDPALETLREILFSHYRQQITELESELDHLEKRVSDKDALVTMITPVLGDVIRHKIRDSRDEMIEALYPIIGQLVLRAVSEAIEDLARKIDAQRRALSLKSLGRRLLAQLGGFSGAEANLRELLPFQVNEIFLIHRETGLLLFHVSHDPSASPDSDLISGMLTAIRDFVKESFGRGEADQLDEIQYGQLSILIETARHAYLAVVVEGIEPAGFRAEIRERIIEINNTFDDALRHYQGDPTPLRSVEDSLRQLASSVSTPQAEISSFQKIILIGLPVLLILCFIAMYLIGAWVWRVNMLLSSIAAFVLVS